MAKRSKGRGPKGPGSNPMQMMQQIQQQVLEAQNQLAEEKITATAGGVVSVTVSGDQRCLAVEISPEVLEDGDAEMLQDLLLTAFNSALDASRQLADERLGPLASGLSGLGLGL